MSSEPQTGLQTAKKNLPSRSKSHVNPTKSCHQRISEDVNSIWGVTWFPCKQARKAPSLIKKKKRFVTSLDPAAPKGRRPENRGGGFMGWGRDSLWFGSGRALASLTNPFRGGTFEVDKTRLDHFRCHLGSLVPKRCQSQMKNITK